MKTHTEDLLESHISFMYTMAYRDRTLLHKQFEIASTRMDEDSRDEVDIEDFSLENNNYQWRTEEEREPSRLSRLSIRKNGFMKSFKKPWKKIKKKSDKEPLMSNNVTKNSVTDWAVVSGGT